MSLLLHGERATLGLMYRGQTSSKPRSYLHPLYKVRYCFVISPEDDRTRSQLHLYLGLFVTIKLASEIISTVSKPEFQLNCTCRAGQADASPCTMTHRRVLPPAQKHIPHHLIAKSYFADACGIIRKQVENLMTTEPKEHCHPKSSWIPGREGFRYYYYMYTAQVTFRNSTYGFRILIIHSTPVYIQVGRL